MKNLSAHGWKKLWLINFFYIFFSHLKKKEKGEHEVC